MRADAARSTAVDPQGTAAASILVVSQFYPPADQGEATVAWKFVASLVERGFRITVISESRPNDVSGWWELPGVSIRRISALPPGVPARLASNLGRLRLGTYWASWWAARAAALGSGLIRHHAFAALVTRTEPSSGVVVGKALRDLTGVPWVAAIGDPHPPCLYPPPYGPGQLVTIRDRAHGRWVARALSRARAVVLPCDRLARWLDRHGVLPGGVPVIVIPHPGLPGVPEATIANRRCLLLHAGTLRLGRTGAPFLYVLERLLRASPELTSQLEIKLLGGADERSLAIARSGLLRGVVSVQPLLPTIELARVMGQADALLLLEAELQEGVFLPSKLSDYAVSGRPVLMFSPRDGTVSDLVGGTRHPGFLSQDPEEAANRLARFVTRRRAGDPCLDYHVSPAPGMRLEEHASLWASLFGSPSAAGVAS
jgi:hypothetical protein